MTVSVLCLHIISMGDRVLLCGRNGYIFIGSPSLTSALIRLTKASATGATGTVILKILAHDQSSENVFASRVVLNGEDVHEPFISHLHF